MSASNITYNVLMNLFIWLILGKKLLLRKILKRHILFSQRIVLTTDYVYLGMFDVAYKTYSIFSCMYMYHSPDIMIYFNLNQ